MKLGASFSHVHLRGLDLGPSRAIKEFKSLNLPWIRLGCYWNEIEKKPGKFSFSQINPLVEFCEKNNINVVLTVGMKAPRYPEYYIPSWLSKKIHLRKLSKISKSNDLLLDAAMNYLENIVKHFKKSKAIKVWQVENEPMDPPGPLWLRINSNFLEAEVALIKKLDPERKILVNLWGVELNKRKVYKKAMTFADVVGLDIYLRRPIPFFKWFNKYIGPSDSKEKIKEIVDEIKLQDKKVWIAELQAEPWEPEELVTKKKNPPSFLPKHFEENLKYAADLKPEVVLLWGFEYWYWKKQNGDLRYWQEAKRVINKYSKL